MTMGVYALEASLSRLGQTERKKKNGKEPSGSEQLKTGVCVVKQLELRCCLGVEVGGS